jgi:hypothetical protein
MGCDIHFYVERKVDDQWIQQFNPNQEEKWKKYWYDSRSYFLFSLLAGVRGPFDPFVEPKGLPQDMSEGLTEEWKGWKDDGHTPSHYTVSELLEHRDKPMIFTGFVNMKNYKIFKKTGKPNDWHDSLYKTNVLPNKEMDRIMNLMAFWNGDDPYTEVAWDGTAADIASNFWEGLAEIQKLDPNPENVRCVFWFDN